MSHENGNKLHKLYDRKVWSPAAPVENNLCRRHTLDKKIHAGITNLT